MKKDVNQYEGIITEKLHSGQRYGADKENAVFCQGEMEVGL